MRSVPSIFFEDGFDIEDTDTFHAACPIRDGSEVQFINKLEGHLDKVWGLLKHVELQVKKSQIYCRSTTNLLHCL